MDVPKPVMPTRLAFQLLGLFNFRAGDQLLDECIEGRADDHDIRASQRRAGGSAAGDLQELHFTGD